MRLGKQISTGGRLLSLFLLAVSVRTGRCETLQELTRSNEFCELTSRSTCLAFCPQQSAEVSAGRGCEFWLATGSENSDTVQFWEMPAQIPGRVARHPGGVKCMGALQTNRGLLFTGGTHDGRVMIWDPDTKDNHGLTDKSILPEQAIFQGPLDASVENVDSNGFGTLVVTFNSRGKREVWVWHFESQSLRYGYLLDHNTATVLPNAEAAAIRPLYDKKLSGLLCVASAGSNSSGTVEVETLDADGSITQKLDMPKGRVQHLVCQPAEQGHLSPGWFLIANGGADGAIQVWASENVTPYLFKPIKTFEQVGAPTEVKLLGEGCDRKYLGIADQGDLNLWKISPWTKFASIAGQRITCFDSAEGQPMLAAVTGTGMRLWHLGTGDPRHFDQARRAVPEWTASVPRDAVLASPDGRFRAMSDESGTSISISATDGRVVAEALYRDGDHVEWPGRWSDGGRFFIVRVSPDENNERWQKRSTAYRVIDTATGTDYGVGSFPGVDCSVETSDAVLAASIDTWRPRLRVDKALMNATSQCTCLSDNLIGRASSDDVLEIQIDSSGRDLTRVSEADIRHPGGVGCIVQQGEVRRGVPNIATGGARDGSVRFYRQEQDGETQVLAFSRSLPGMRVTSIALPGMLAASFHDPARNQDRVCLWNMWQASSRDSVTTLPGCCVATIEMPERQLIVVGERERRLTGGETTVGRAIVYDLETLKPIEELLMPSGSVTSVSYSEPWLSACGGRGGTAVVWENTESGWRQVKCFEKLTAPSQIAFHYPFLALLDNGSVSIWRAGREWCKIFTLPGQDVRSIGFYSGTLIVLRPKGAEVWDVLPPKVWKTAE